MKKSSVWKKACLASVAAALVASFIGCANPANNDAAGGDATPETPVVKTTTISGDFTTDDKGLVDISEKLASDLCDVKTGDWIVLSEEAITVEKDVGVFGYVVIFDSTVVPVTSTMEYAKDKKVVEGLKDVYVVQSDAAFKGIKLGFAKPLPDGAADGTEPDPLANETVTIKNLKVKVIKSADLDSCTTLIADAKDVALTAQKDSKTSAYAGSMQGEFEGKKALAAEADFVAVITHGAITTSGETFQYTMDETNWNWKGSSTGAEAGTYVTVGKNGAKEAGVKNPWGGNGWAVGIQCDEDAITKIDSVMIRTFPEL